MIVATCPFCGKEHEVDSFRNVTCRCDSYTKLYVRKGFWLGRRGKHEGERVMLQSEEKRALDGFINSLFGK